MIPCIAIVVTWEFLQLRLTLPLPLLILSPQHFLPFHIPQTLIFGFRDLSDLIQKTSILPTSSTLLPHLLHPYSLHTT